MDRLISIANRAVADYGFRQAVLYSPGDIGHRAGFTQEEQSVLEGTVLELLAALPIPVQPEDIPGEQARMAAAIRTAAGG
jgi:hypothetical protein